MEAASIEVINIISLYIHQGEYQALSSCLESEGLFLFIDSFLKLDLTNIRTAVFALISCVLEASASPDNLRAIESQLPISSIVEAVLSQLSHPSQDLKTLQLALGILKAMLVGPSFYTYFKKQRGLSQLIKFHNHCKNSEERLTVVSILLQGLKAGFLVKEKEMAQFVDIISSQIS